jgi:small-conductance mechanosensitive channel
LYAQLNREGDEDSQKKMRTRVEKLEAEIADFNEKLVKERNLQRNKANAYYRKVETENMRQHLQDEKKYFKENTKHATNDDTSSELIYSYHTLYFTSAYHFFF